jgi:hypothetical protein
VHTVCADDQAGRGRRSPFEFEFDAIATLRESLELMRQTNSARFFPL